MGSRGLLSFADALELLGVDSERVAALDRALGGALNVATGGVSGTVLGIVSGRGRIIGAGRDAVRGLGERLGRATARAERTEVLRAAHTVIVVVAWFEALGAAELPLSLDEVELTRDEQMTVAGARAGEHLVRELLTLDLPYPEPHEDFHAYLTLWYQGLASRFAAFVSGLALWERMTETQRDAFHGTTVREVPPAAVARYRALYAQLCLAAPDPVFRNLGPAVLTFVPGEGAPATSLAHDLLCLLLDDARATPAAELAACYTRVLRGMSTLPGHFAALDRVVDLLLTAYHRDRERLPAVVTERVEEFIALAVDLAHAESRVPQPTRLRLRRVLARHYPSLFST
ncbi:hypothetical protein [Streptomyces sp. NPDC046939]|uniref:NACHT N-terminal helical domain 7-containing protein n=1 Tax=Streptomyces sp. NPDC046939 TaxID=3155376 RepID=UPI0033E90A94